MKTKEQYRAEGHADGIAQRPRRTGFTSNSWQENAYDAGFNAGFKEAVSATQEPMRTTDACTLVRPSERRREAHIRSMVAGYTEAMLLSSGGETDPDDEDTTLESLEGFDLAEETVAKARDICTRFYDANRTDLAAYADIKKHAPEHGPYECIGHDLWLTTAGHGVGFWDRGMGRVGERLSAQCGYFKPFGHLDAYLGDDRLVYLS